MKVSRMPSVGKFMARPPISIPSTLSLIDAWEVMRRERIRHLPVERGGKVVGIVSDRDAKALQDLAHLPVEALMTTPAYTVTEETPLNRVIAMMADRKYGSVIIVDGEERAIGIFTSTDALRALAFLLGENFFQADSDRLSASSA